MKRQAQNIAIKQCGGITWVSFCLNIEGAIQLFSQKKKKSQLNKKRPPSATRDRTGDPLIVRQEAIILPDYAFFA